MNTTEKAKKIIKEYLSNGLTIEEDQVPSEELANSLHYCIKISEEKIKDEYAVPLGISKNKGLPHLPPFFEWPKGLYFRAQLNLKDLSKYDVDNLLPTEGILYIFSDTSELECKIIHYKGNTEDLVITPYPEDMEFPWEEYYLEGFKNRPYLIKYVPFYMFFIPHPDFPKGQIYNTENVYELIPENLKEKLGEVFNCKMTRDDIKDRIFGRPSCSQGEPMLDWDEILLFQYEDGEPILHFWISPEDLSKADFSNCFMTGSTT